MKTVKEFFKEYFKLGLYDKEEYTDNMKIRAIDAIKFTEQYCEEKTCEWKYDEEFCFYDTECDEAYQLEVGDLDENKHNYCPFCGGKIVLNKPINNNIMKTDLENAINVLTDSLAEDSDYYHGWLANIAMAMYDEFKEAGISHPQLHELCNKGAKRFLDYLINL